MTFVFTIRSEMVASMEYVMQDSLKKIKNFEKVSEISKFQHEIFNPYRLIILVGLYKAGFQSFQQLKILTKMNSDGNLASHLRSLEKAKLIEYHKSFAGKRPITFYNLTDDGKEIFEAVIKSLEKLLAGLSM